MPASISMKGQPSRKLEVFQQMSNNYGIASGLETKINKVTLQVVKGQECFRVFQNLNLTQAQRADDVTIVNVLNDYFVPKTNVTYERYKFSTGNFFLQGCVGL